MTRIMSVAFSRKSSEIFEVIPEAERSALYADICAASVVLIGRSQDHSVIVFRPRRGTGGSVFFEGRYRSNSKKQEPVEATFSFVLKETKYLFRAELRKKDHQQGELHLLTMIYRIQRRAVKRLKIPLDYYAVVRVSHHNTRLIRSFGKLVDISPRGLGVLLANLEVKIKVGDLLRVVLTISQRPPETIDLRVIHLNRPNHLEEKMGDKTEGQFFGAICMPENSISVFKRMNAVVMDIYRDLFGALTESSESQSSSRKK